MRISNILSERRPVFSLEFFPPKSEEAALQLEKMIGELRPLEPDYVSVSMEQAARRLAEAGVENVLALRGDPPKGESTLTPVAAGGPVCQ